MSTVENRSALRAGCIAIALAPALLLAATATGWCGSKKEAAPAPRAAAPSRPSFSGPQNGGFGGRSGGASPVHIPGSVNTSAHVPGSVAGSARGMGGSAGASVHLPSSMANRYASHPAQAGAAQPATRVAMRQPHAASPQAAHPGAPRETAPRADTRIAARTTPSAPARPAMDQRRADIGGPRSDPRLGEPNGRAMHTAGVTGASVVHAGPRPFLRPDPHRDVAHDRQFAHDHAADFHTRRVADFDRHEMHRWREGLWRNEWHYGRRGWWYEVDDVDYAYPDPIFPYPEDVAPLVVYDTPFIDGPDLTLVELGPGAPADPGLAAAGAPPADIPPLPATPVGWYRCDQPGGYYPGLDTCGTYWALVQNAPMPGE